MDVDVTDPRESNDVLVWRTLTRMTRPRRTRLWMDRDVWATAGCEFG